ncbi:hypothetical protein [Trujillonella endophytica]|uniref:EthD domain-containing protein n=1 Tax=Trujillonella endophytica TaxID=673521 RepID=A0A1H8W774_9ACTN|nr:hypothetical protein [Trujillella endophytica]SEP23459.1 hypothetical protein SAMN05660991_04134 [Trujillella endophytica]
MAKALLIAYSSAVPGKDAEYEQWYDEIHIPDVRAAIPSVTGVSRYRLVDLTGGTAAPRYVAVYELGDADVATAAGQLGAAGQAGRLRPTDTIDMTGNPPDLQWFAATGADA